MEPTLPCRLLIQFDNTKANRSDFTEKLSNPCLYLLRTASGTSVRVSNGSINKAHSLALRILSGFLALTICIPLTLLGIVFWALSGSHSAKYQRITELRSLMHFKEQLNSTLNKSLRPSTRTPQLSSSSSALQPPTLSLTSTAAGHKPIHTATSSTPKASAVGGRASPLIGSAPHSPHTFPRSESTKLRALMSSAPTVGSADTVDSPASQLPKKIVEILQAHFKSTLSEDKATQQIADLILQVPYQTELDKFLNNLINTIPSTFESYRIFFEAVALAASWTPNDALIRDLLGRSETMEKDLQTIRDRANQSATKAAPEDKIVSKLKEARTLLEAYHNDSNVSGRIADGVHSIGIQFMKKILGRRDAAQKAQMAFTAFLALYKSCIEHQVCWPKGLSCLGEVAQSIKSLKVLGSAVDAALTTSGLPLDDSTKTNLAIHTLLNFLEGIIPGHCVEVEADEALQNEKTSALYKPDEFLNGRVEKIEKLVAENLTHAGLISPPSRLNSGAFTPLVLIMQYFLDLPVTTQPDTLEADLEEPPPAELPENTVDHATYTSTHPT